MTLTLQQIFNFGTAMVDKEKISTVNDKEYSRYFKGRRYKRDIIVYAAKIFYGYTNKEISNIFNIQNCGSYINSVKKSNHKQESAYELYCSLEKLYNKGWGEKLRFYISNLKAEFQQETGETIEHAHQPTTFEIWLITRLYGEG